MHMGMCMCLHPHTDVKTDMQKSRHTDTQTQTFRHTDADTTAIPHTHTHTADRGATTAQIRPRCRSKHGNSECASPTIRNCEGGLRGPAAGSSCPAGARWAQSALLLPCLGSRKVTGRPRLQYGPRVSDQLPHGAPQPCHTCALAFPLPRMRPPSPGKDAEREHQPCA